jgi:hypothetical protein
MLPAGFDPYVSYIKKHVNKFELISVVIETSGGNPDDGDDTYGAFSRQSERLRNENGSSTAKQSAKFPASWWTDRKIPEECFETLTCTVQAWNGLQHPPGEQI